MSVRRKAPAFCPIFVDDYLGGTFGWSAAEHGAYLTAMLFQWSSGAAQSVTEEKLARWFRGTDWNGLPECVLEKFQRLPDGSLRNLRMQQEFLERNRISLAQSLAGRSAQAKLREKRGAKLPAQHRIQSQSQTTETDTSSLRSDVTLLERTSMEEGTTPAPRESRPIESEGGKKRAARAKKGNGPVQLSWVAAACDDWKELVGGTPPGGRIGAAVGALCRQLGRDVLELTGLDEAQVFERIRGVWRFYLGSEKAEFVNPQGFAQKFGVWAQRASGVTDPRREKLDPVAASLERFRDAGDTGKGGLL